MFSKEDFFENIFDAKYFPKVLKPVRVKLALKRKIVVSFLEEKKQKDETLADGDFVISKLINHEDLKSRLRYYLFDEKVISKAYADAFVFATENLTFSNLLLSTDLINYDKF